MKLDIIPKMLHMLYLLHIPYHFNETNMLFVLQDWSTKITISSMFIGMTSIDPLNMRDLASQNRQQTSTWNLEDLPPMNLYDYLGNGNVKSGRHMLE